MTKYNNYLKILSRGVKTTQRRRANHSRENLKMKIQRWTQTDPLNTKDVCASVRLPQG